MRLLLIALAALTLSFGSVAAGSDLPLRPLAIGKHKLTAEVAATSEQRSTGLMNRFSLRPDHGMLFIFEQPERLAFWMKNTFIPLSIAFIARGRPDRQHRGHGAAVRDVAPVAGARAVCAGDAQGLVRRARDSGRRLGHRPSGSSAGAVTAGSSDSAARAAPVRNGGLPRAAPPWIPPGLACRMSRIRQLARQRGSGRGIAHKQTAGAAIQRDGG